MHSWNQGKGTVYVTSGVGYGTTALAAFDAAELDARIMATNAIRVTSFVPPGWNISKDKKILAEKSGKGAFLPMAYQYSVSNTERATSALVIGVNEDPMQASIIMEHAEIGIDQAKLLTIAKESSQEVFGFRKWKVKEYVEAVASGEPKDGLHVCALVAALYFPDGE